MNAVAISQGVPKWYKGKVYKKLAPSWALVKIEDEKEYVRRYKYEVLDRLDPAQVLKELGEDAVLLCWEKPGEFCHRRIVAEWLEGELGIEVPELGVRILGKKRKFLQDGSLENRSGDAKPVPVQQTLL